LCVFSFFSPSFIGADQLGFHATFTLSALAALSEYGDIRTQRVSCAKHAFTFQNHFPSAKRAFPVDSNERRDEMVNDFYFLKK